MIEPTYNQPWTLYISRTTAITYISDFDIQQQHNNMGRTLEESFMSNDLVDHDGFLFLPEALPMLLDSSSRPIKERLRKSVLTAAAVIAASVSN